jgi:hypothetical protein
MEDKIDFMDAILMGLDSMDADLKRPDEVMHLFDFSV